MMATRTDELRTLFLRSAITARDAAREERNIAQAQRNDAYAALRVAMAELAAARQDAAEYRSLVDRCRERNKELGAECERLRDALGQIDAIVSALETDNSAQDAA